MFDVPDDADYFAVTRLFARTFESNSLAYWVFVWPVLLCQHLVNDGDTLSVGVIALREIPSFDQRNIHRLHIARGDPPPVAMRRLLSLWHLMMLDVKASA